METITFQLIGEEDINIGDGTFDVTLADGRIVPLTKVSADSFPIKSATLATLPNAGTFGRLRYLTDTQTLVLDNGDEWVAAPPGRGVFYPDIESGADFDTLINDLITAMPAEGGTIDARGFQGSLSCNATIMIEKPVRLLLGHCTITSTASPIIEVTTDTCAVIEGSSRGATVLQTTSASQSGIDINTTAPVRISSLTINHNGATKTSGAGILITAPSNQNEQSRIHDVSILDQHTGILVNNAARLVVSKCHIRNYQRAGISVQNLAAVDYGDNVIDSCVIENVATTAGLFGIWHISASGLRVSNCRIIGGEFGYVMEVGGTAEAAMLNGNYISGQSAASVYLTRTSGSETFLGVTVINNVIRSDGDGVVCTSSGIHHLVITNNLIYAPSPNACIHIIDVSYCHIDVASLVSNGGASVGIQVDSGTAVHIGSFTLDGVTTPIVNTGIGTHIEPYIVHGTVSIDPGSINATTRGSATFTLTGAKTGDRIVMEPPAGLNDDLLFVGARITSDNTVTVYLYNGTGGPIDDGANTWNFTHLKKWI